MATISGGDGGQAIEGGAENDRLYGHSAADEQPSAGAITATRVAAGLAAPVFAASPPGDPDRLFVLEKNTGAIRILDLSTGAVAATPFLDIANATLSTDGERGALGLAFHPEYQSNGRFFVYVTNAGGDIELREYARGASASVADPASGRVLLTIEHSQFSNHNGGWIGFGPDGLLYLGVGDGGGSGDPGGNAQNLESLLGKVLRIDVNGDEFPGDPLRNYAIPDDNPFVGRAGADEIFASGLRNPFRMSFDGATGELYVGDVGEGRREEVDVLQSGAAGGANLGWRVYEASLPFGGGVTGGAGQGGFTAPVLEYGRGLGRYEGQSITGGQVYRGPGGAQGLYVFGDFVSGNLWTARIEGGRSADFVNRNDQLEGALGAPDAMVGFVLDGRGRLYVIGIDGEVHRLDFSPSAGDGADLIRGGEGDDVIHGGAGDDGLSGDGGTDRIFGGFGFDTLAGGAGRDVLAGGAGNDGLFGDGDGDELFGEAGDDFLEGGLGDDGLGGGAGLDQLFGGAGADFITGGDGADGLLGGDGDDQLFGEGGADFMLGGAGLDALIGGAGQDSLYGEDGNDWMIGGADGDALIGGGGRDHLEGGEGGDWLDGGADGDVIIGGAGPDGLVGGAGADRFVLTNADVRPTVSPNGRSIDPDRVFDFDPRAGDVIDLSGIDADLTQPGDQALRIGSSLDIGTARLTYVASSDTTVLEIEVNGDGLPDHQLTLNGFVDGSTGFVL